jgi:anti-sigma factor RsiW
MIAEDVEFQISQYADGTLGAGERASIDALLNADPQARQMLAEYRRLNVQLAQLRLPEIKWDKLAENISDSILSSPRPAEQTDRRLIAGRIGWTAWSGGLRVAAAILIATTVGIVTYRTLQHTGPAQPIRRPPVISDVVGPSADVAEGKPLEDVSVGPSAIAAGEAHDIQNAIVPRPSRVIINEAIATPTKDKRHPH